MRWLVPVPELSEGAQWLVPVPELSEGMR
jgi:hypothetical protein